MQQFGLQSSSSRELVSQVATLQIVCRYTVPWIYSLFHATLGALNDYQKDQQFRKLNDIKDTIEIKTLRGGQMTMVTNHDLVVGDVVLLDAGDKVVADMIMFESHGLIIDEASLTGESDPIKKHLDSDPWIRSGTQVRDRNHCRVSEVSVTKFQAWGSILCLSHSLRRLPCVACPDACLVDSSMSNIRFLREAERRWSSRSASTASGERP